MLLLSNLMKKILIYTGIVVILVAIICIMGIKIENLKSDVDYAYNNTKALIAESDSLRKTNIAYKLTLAEFETATDSISKKFKQVLADNKIKTKKIQSLQYQLEHISKTETLYVRDTIFKEPEFKLDTCISDKWSKTCLHMQYPNVVSVNSQFNNEKYIIFKHKREPIKYKKCKIAQWFTRKHTVVEITVIDENPYVTTPKQRFVEIIDNKSK